MNTSQMKMMSLFATIMMAFAACGGDDDHDDHDHGSQNTTDSESTDGTEADAGTEGDAAGLPADATPSFGAGCSAADDQAFLKVLTDNADGEAGKVTNIVKDCTLTKGCMAKDTEDEQKDCIRDCVLESDLVKSNKVSNDCAACFGTYKGWCGAKKCLAQCAVDAGSQACGDCLASNCDSVYDLCLAGDPK
ncbi:MAG TPA: hypothetical protein DCQ06_04635 [Myxococcales bacterium]|nr:hypothetical protein [Myxococcales bacterium]HAN30862.1 hypothetical protein [Myxococcales bacterium]